jgi:hypothetical protein
MIGGGGPVAKMLGIKTKAGHGLMAGFFYA